MIFYFVFRRFSSDVRRTHCIICKEPISNWEKHVLSSRHVALRAIGNHFYSYNPAKSKHLFESGLQSALGVSSSVLAKERKPVNKARYEYLKSLISHLLHSENYPMKYLDMNRKIVIGGAILRKEATLLACRLHPKWRALSIQAIVDTITTKAHLLHVTKILSIDTEFFDLEATIGHFHVVEHEKPEEIILRTLTKHAITCIVFELYNSFVWDSMNHLTTVWENYLLTRKTMIEEVQRVNEDEIYRDWGDSPCKHQDSARNFHPCEIPWTVPKACVSYNVSGTQIHQKLMRVDRISSIEKKNLNSSSAKIAQQEKCYPLIQNTKKRIGSTFEYTLNENFELETLRNRCKERLTEGIRRGMGS